ncbi:MAG TPA: DUF3604 domain-containing protein [Myxococcota bacterium]|nr:DUF3604 domain-containing protein [Myxococcota bacterium]
MRALRLVLGALCGAALLVSAASAEEPATCVSRDPLKRPWFGDLHVHTRWSLDASTQGTRTSPADAYRFAQGEALGLHPFDADGRALRKVRLARPLDFAAVTDHSELFGEVAMCRDEHAAGYGDLVCQVYRGWPRLAFFLMNARGTPRFSLCGENGAACLAAARGPWQEMRDAAEAAQDHSDACRFTTFVGYEWTKTVQSASNLHRNVIFRNEHVPEVPASALEALTPEALWDALDRDCRHGIPDCDAVVIPHNSNLSSGWMFAAEALSDGRPMDADHARRRALNEPLVEIMQHKGESECRTGAGTTDELCGFEKLPYDSFMGRFSRFARQTPAATNYVRTALGQGLVDRVKLGANPFEFGVIGSTDTHIGAPGLVLESGDYPGHGGAGIPIGDALPDSLLDPIEYNPGGLAVLWAEENSRPALFAALQRRETYATSGPRIVLRVFGGWGLPGDLCQGDFAVGGIAMGVPMGATLPPPPAPVEGADATPPSGAGAAPSGAPAIAISALRDPGGNGDPSTPLQRAQVVKLWVGEDGAAHEKVVDVAGDARNGASVDPRTCETHGDGADQLCAVWRDPEFDPARPALYYVRVLENPVCRWSTRACNQAGIDCAKPETVRTGFEGCCDPEIPKTIQERAWSSPIWYTPAN